MNRFNRGTHPFAGLVKDLVEHLRAQQEEQPGEMPETFTHQEILLGLAEAGVPVEYLGRVAAHFAGQPGEPKAVNRNVARAERCGADVIPAGAYRIEFTEDMVVFTMEDLDKFVSECGKIDKV